MTTVPVAACVPTSTAPLAVSSAHSSGCVAPAGPMSQRGNTGDDREEASSQPLLPSSPPALGPLPVAPPAAPLPPMLPGGRQETGLVYLNFSARGSPWLEPTSASEDGHDGTLESMYRQGLRPEFCACYINLVDLANPPAAAHDQLPRQERIGSAVAALLAQPAAQLRLSNHIETTPRLGTGPHAQAVAFLRIVDPYDDLGRLRRAFSAVAGEGELAGCAPSPGVVLSSFPQRLHAEVLPAVEPLAVLVRRAFNTPQQILLHRTHLGQPFSRAVLHF